MIIFAKNVRLKRSAIELVYLIDYYHYLSNAVAGVVTTVKITFFKSPFRRGVGFLFAPTISALAVILSEAAEPCGRAPALSTALCHKTNPHSRRGTRRPDGEVCRRGQVGTRTAARSLTFLMWFLARGLLTGPSSPTQGRRRGFFLFSP